MKNTSQIQLADDYAHSPYPRKGTASPMTEVSLSRLDGASVEYLTQLSGSLKTLLRDESEQALQTATAMIQRNPGILQRIFPDALQKESRDIAVHQLRQVASNKRTLLEAYSKVQLEIVAQEGDVVMKSHALHVRGYLAAFAMEKFEQLSQTLADSQSRFMSNYVPREQEIEQYSSSPELYKRAHTALLHQLDVYFDTIDELLDGFKTALSNRVPKN
jgi:hypothetical protein